MKDTEWFSTWFDTSYYHLLYEHRNENEASAFIENITKALVLPLGANVLDLACGKGRHSIKLCELGYNVLGVDLSKNSIDIARKNSSEHLHFAVHDMREIILDKKFDAVFNLFTSFGYFDKMEDNFNVINSIHKMLNPNGRLVIDFMNANKTIKNLSPSDEKTVNGIKFSIKRNWDGNHIFKNIDVFENGKSHQFLERVQSLLLSDFEELLKGKFKINKVWGNYNLNEFDEENSDRLIIYAERIEWN